MNWGRRRSRPMIAAAATAGVLGVLVALSGCVEASSGVAGPWLAPTAGGPTTKHRPGHRPSRTPEPGPDAPRPTPSVVPTPSAIGFDAALLSHDDPASPWVVVNKPRGLNPAGYEPADLVYPDVTYVNRQPLRREAADALVALFRAGKAEAGLDFSVQSAYRSFDSQTRVYADDVARNGQAYADTDTARPGHSEHQTGLAVDISAVPAKCSLAACFAQTPQGAWLAANAWRFGFLLRYPADKVEVTGFTFEPWHYRYIGVPLAAHLHDAGVTTLEEFFRVPGGTQY